MAILDDYKSRLADGEIEADPAQRDIVRRLDTLQRALEARGAAPPASILKRFFAARPSSQPAPTRGLYIHGGVGRGKTMLMDLFFASIAIAPKRRAHFHEFMADIHDRIADARHQVPGDPIPHVARAIAAEASLLCLDELHVRDIADAMILTRLFAGLFNGGIIVVATSNVHPTDLYKDGLNRSLFLPFIDLVTEHMDVVELVSPKDFRLEKLSGQTLYFAPTGPSARASLDRHWDRLTGRHPGEAQTITVKGRRVVIPIASMGAARFRFDDLCEQPLGALDYLHLAHTFHTLFIDDIPVLGRDRRNAARRFITLIDALYDNRVCLIASAEAEPHELYPAGDGADHFARTASRLMEMRSEAYIGKSLSGQGGGEGGQA